MARDTGWGPAIALHPQPRHPEQPLRAPQLLSKGRELVTFSLQQYLTLPKQLALGVFPEIVRPTGDTADIWMHYR